MIRLALLGATGRMGSRVVDLLGQDDRFELVAALTRDGDPRVGETFEVRGRELEIARTCDADFDVLLDFSVPAGTMAWLDACMECGAAMVIGATGYTDGQLDRLRSASKQIAVFHASNFSLGIHILMSLCRETARALGEQCDIEIIEQHHNKKVDAPSGTAIALSDAMREARGGRVACDVIFGRSGQVGERPTDEIGIHAVRMGAMVGQHEVHFALPGETISVRHVAHSRDIFARSGLNAAEWVAARSPGLYSMTDLLSIASYGTNEQNTSFET